MLNRIRRLAPVFIALLLAISSSATLLAQFGNCTASSVDLGDPYNGTWYGPASDGTWTYQYNYTIDVTCSAGYTSQCNAYIRLTTYDDEWNALAVSYSMLPGYAQCGQVYHGTCLASFGGLRVGSTYILEVHAVPFIAGSTDCSTYNYVVTSGSAISVTKTP
jgi:hypothetical protein